MINNNTVELCNSQMAKKINKINQHKQEIID